MKKKFEAVATAVTIKFFFVGEILREREQKLKVSYSLLFLYLI
jgi:hypothetical protein